MSTTELITTENCGKADGPRVSDSPPSGDLAASTISRIALRMNSHCVFSFTVYYSWNSGQAITHGSATVDSAGFSGQAEFTLGPNEYITSIEGKSTANSVNQLIFMTTKQRYGPYGGTDGESFIWAPPGSGVRLVAFACRSDQFLHSIQATFARMNQEIRQNPTKTTQYESLSIRDTPTSDPGAGIGDSIAHSKFGRYFCSPPLGGKYLNLMGGFLRHLMCPIATLFVGPKRVQFHAHEDTLCTLPFFQAALQGLFKEASEKAISMPDDDPRNISALIEFLYTGNYTYTYDPTSIKLREMSTTPIGDLAEGLYHVGVYVVASKYDSPVLSEMAVKNFEAVAVELDDIDDLRLWKAAYTENLGLSRCMEDYKEYSSGKGLVSWVKGLFREHGEEMDEMFAECPQLATDLLRIATGDE